MKDICCIGHVTKDKIVTPNRTVYMAGGTSFYFAYAINQLPKDVSFSLITAMDPTETEPVEKMRQAGIEVTLNPSRNTVFFENIYGENQNERKQRVLAKADPFTIRQLEHVEAKVYHLGSLLSDDFSPEVVEFLSRSGRVSIDVQGYLREVRDEKVYPIDWKDKLEVLKNTYIFSFKIDSYMRGHKIYMILKPFTSSFDNKGRWITFELFFTTNYFFYDSENENL